MTQLDLARAIGTSSASISEWEADKKVPRDESLVRLAKVLEVSPAYLRYGEGSVMPPVGTPDEHEEGAWTHMERTKKAAPKKAAKKRRRA